ncbi:MAG: hypothetical protein ACLVBA_16900 [Alistipes finegoldii]|uniref:hypothetical protein n=1 Tax=Alistipes finegoldii TaxID=214856 RepID=UPI00399D32BF
MVNTLETEGVDIGHFAGTQIHQVFHGFMVRYRVQGFAWHHPAICTTAAAFSHFL